MNKLFIVVLAVCLVSVNSAIVKREVETASPNYLEDAQKRIQELGSFFQKHITEALDPEQIKKSFGEGIDNINKFLDPTKQQAPK